MTELSITDAEVGLLNILFLNPETAFESSTGVIKPYMFSSTPNQIIFTIIQEIMEIGSVPEYNMIMSFANSSGKIKEVGGVDYLAYIKNQVYDKNNKSQYEKQIMDAYKARSLRTLANEIPKGLGNISEVDDVIARIRDSLDNLIENSGGESTELLRDTLKDVWEEIVSRANKPGLRGPATGIKSIDDTTAGLGAGDYWIIASRPSMGKTATLCNMALSLAKQGVGTLIFELEMPKQSLVERLLSIETGIPIINIRLGSLTQQEIDKLSDAIKLFKTLPIYIDCTFGMTAEYISSTIRKFKKTKNIRVVFLDYIQLLAGRDDDQTAELGRISRLAKMLSNELDITFIVLSQLNRLVELRNDKRPVLSDLRQSGNLEEDADLVLFLYRDVVYNSNTRQKDQLEFIIRKHRNGPTGTVVSRFEDVNNRIVDNE